MVILVPLKHTQSHQRLFCGAVPMTTLTVLEAQRGFQVDTLKSRILIADPDPDVSRMLHLYFEANSHEAQVVDLAGDVLGAARSWQPNAILISAEFTDKNPYHVCQEILQDTLTAHIPIIMLLHLDDRRSRLEALEVGADDIVTKPIDIEELRLRVEAAIRLSTLRVHA